MPRFIVAAIGFLPPLLALPALASSSRYTASDDAPWWLVAIILTSFLAMGFALVATVVKLWRVAATPPPPWLREPPRRRTPGLGGTFQVGGGSGWEAGGQDGWSVDSSSGIDASGSWDDTGGSDSASSDGGSSGSGSWD
jgi:hypothetical protein